MSAVAAEQLPMVNRPLHLSDQRNLPEFVGVVDVSLLETEELNQKRAERLFRSAGAIALQGVNETEVDEQDKFSNLHDALISAKEGNTSALNMVRTNIATDRFERTKKVQFVIDVELNINEDGEIVQFGQTNEQIQANTLHYCANNSKMLPRYMAETRNKYRMQTALQNRNLDDYWFVVFSPCADDMTDEELTKEGFFAPTKSMSIQATTIKNGKVVVESAFVAGVKNEDEDRHDLSTLTKIGDMLEVDLSGTAAELIDTPLLIPKSLMPDGVINIVELYDATAGETFFGEDKPRQGYAEFAKTCRQEREEAAHQAEEMLQILLARWHEATDPVSASWLLGDVVGKYMAEAAVEDERIDLRVFGTQAAFYITDARAHIEAGNFERARLMIQRATRTQQSSSCPGGVKSGATPDDRLDDLPSDLTSQKKEDETGDCDFVSKECPLCHTKNVHTTVRSGEYKGSCGCSSKTGKRRKKPDTDKPANKVVSLSDERNKRRVIRRRESNGNKKAA